MRTKNHYELWRKCIYVCVCVWWASRNLHEARTRLKLLLLSQRKTSRKRTSKTRRKNNMNGTKQKWEKQQKYSLAVWPTVTAFTWFRDHQQSNMYDSDFSITTFPPLTSSAQLSSAQLPTVSGFRPVSTLTYVLSFCYKSGSKGERLSHYNNSG
jgi:hypothetical protein